MRITIDLTKKEEEYIRNRILDEDSVGRIHTNFPNDTILYKVESMVRKVSK